MKKMSQKEIFIKNINKKLKAIKKVDSKYYVTVIGLLILAVLAKKYRAKIIFLFKKVLNI